MVQSKLYGLPAILVVEDEVLVRMDLVDTIRDAGFRTYEAATAREAILLMEAHSDIAVLFTDIQVSGPMDGLKLSHYVRNRWPPVRIVIASGHVRATAAQMPLHSIFIAKPYQPFELETILQDIEQVHC